MSTFFKACTLPPDEPLIYPQKFLPETWDILCQSNLAQQSASPGDFYDYVLCRWFGLTMMSILAEECAGSTKRLLTDEQDSYAALGKYLTSQYGNSYSNSNPSDRERLLTISIMSVGVDDIPLNQMIELRENESPLLREYRHNYLKSIDSYAEDISKTVRPGDKEEIERKFDQSMKDDFVELNRALRRKAVGTLLSKEMCVAVLAAAGAVVEPWTSSVVGVGALVKSLSDYRSGREEIMRKHATSWLYQARGRFKSF